MIVVAALTGRALVAAVISLADPYRLIVSPDAFWERWETIQVFALAACLGAVVARSMDALESGFVRAAKLGVASGLLAAAAELMGIVVAGLATEWLFRTWLHQDLAFPALVAACALLLAMVWRRLATRRARWLACGIGLLSCALLGWACVRWVIPEHLRF